MHFKNGLEEIIGDGVDLIFCNESEALGFTGKETVKEAALELKKISRSFAITLGPRGAYIFDGKKEIDVYFPSIDKLFRSPVFFAYSFTFST